MAFSGDIATLNASAKSVKASVDGVASGVNALIAAMRDANGRLDFLSVAGMALLVFVMLAFVVGGLA